MDSSSEPTITDATAVVLIVHGVGDHKVGAIIHELEAGFHATVSPQNPQETTRTNIDLRSLLPEDSAVRSLQGLYLNTSSGGYCLIPLVWSELRKRYVRQLESLDRGPLDTPLPRLPRSVPKAVLNWLISLRRVVAGFLNLTRTWYWYQLELIKLGLGSLRCSQSRFWKLVLAGVALPLVWCLAGISYGLRTGVLPLVAIPVLMALWARANFQPEIDGQVVAWIMVITTVALTCIGSVGVIAMDMVADVLFYVENSNHRDQVHRLIRGIIEGVRSEAPQARIFVVGHSLGSVAVTHALLEMQNGSVDARPPIYLLTFGSPLNLMSRVFGKVVFSPAQVQRRYAESGAVKFWLHVWRDSDVIGRALRASTSGEFRQVSLGDGPHWGYWSDPRVWGMSTALMGSALTAESGEFDNIVQLSTGQGITWKEMSEADSLQRLWLSGIVASILGYAIAWYSSRAYLSEQDAPLLLNAWYKVAQIALQGLVAASAILGLLCTIQILWFSKSARNRLANLRFWRFPIIVSEAVALVMLLVLLYGLLHVLG